ncbi:MAG TPA: hypothetical protein EYP14_12655, partial [Planctomycetaceae bacterium]|nr:hypothetical protein [Planctomycetaceae bacterium]
MNLHAFVLCLLASGYSLGSAGPDFYRPENAAYTIVDSAKDSVRFALTKCVTECRCGQLRATSSFVDPEGRVMGWHDFGHLEGPGWAANAVGGAYEMYRFGKFLHRPDWQRKSLRVLDHVLEHGFIDQRTGFIRGYRETTTGRFCLNYKHNSDWFCPGSMARIAYQLVLFADALPESDGRRQRMYLAAARCAAWIARHVPNTPNGWYPRRCDRAGNIYKKSPTGGEDPFWQSSGDGMFIVQLQVALSERGLADQRATVRSSLNAFVKQGGIFGSINHDTYDPQENVAYAVAFRTLLAAAR